MYVVFDDRQLDHHPQAQFYAGLARRAPEVPARAVTLLQASLESGLRRVEADDYGWAPIEEIHDPGYIGFLKDASEDWAQVKGSGPEVFPHVHPVRYQRAMPGDVQGKAGYYMNTTNCPIGPNTLSSAYSSAQAAVKGAKLLLDKEPLVYSLCRPPGHHAHKDMASAFCFFNNVAIAAHELSKVLGKVAVIDIDVHHGNGTQEIFYDRDDVFCGSVHADPTDFYPFYQGFEKERGEGAGEGWNVNIPLPNGAGNEQVSAATQALVNHALELECRAIVVALGFDTYAEDPLGRFNVTTEGFSNIAKEIQSSGLPILLIQEGGYDGPNLGANLKSFLNPLLHR